jgi:hypothetical protein
MVAFDWRGFGRLLVAAVWYRDTVSCVRLGRMCLSGVLSVRCGCRLAARQNSDYWESGLSDSSGWERELPSSGGALLLAFRLAADRRPVFFTHIVIYADRNPFTIKAVTTVALTP